MSVKGTIKDVALSHRDSVNTIFFHLDRDEIHTKTATVMQLWQIYVFA